MSRKKHPDPGLVELETENKRLNREIEMLQRANAELRETNNKLKQSLEESVRSTKPKPALPGRGPSSSQPGASSETAASITDSELRQEDQTIQQLRQQLLNVQERLTVAEQVAAAKQKRELREQAVYQNVPPQSVYEELRFDPAQEHVYASLQPTTHKDVLRAQYGDLTTKLDAHIVAVHMYQRNALTLKELQSIQSLRGRPVEAAETLLNFIMEQPDAVYLCFLDVLKDTEQQHIYQRLVQDGYKDYDDQSSHTSVIRAHYVYLLERLDVKFSGLVDQLYSDQVISAVERDDIGAEPTSFIANEKLLSALSRKSPQQFQLFLDALDNCGQPHVRNVIDHSPVEQVHILPEGPPVMGVTTLGDQIYLLRLKGRDKIEVYNAATYCLNHCLTVTDSVLLTDMTSCKHFLCLYIADSVVKCIHRQDLQGNATKWPVSDTPDGLSVNLDHNLIVICRYLRKINEFSPRGDLLRDVILPDDVTNPWHAIQLTSGEFFVCHGEWDDQVHRVCLVSADGREIVCSHGGQRGSDTDQYNVPARLAVDDEFVFVVDRNNRRVTLLSPTLNYIVLRQVVARDQVKWKPERLCLDVQRRRLYVAANCSTAGRVVVFTV